MNTTKINSMIKWADRENLEHRPIGSFIDGVPTQTGIVVYTDFYTGPYPDQRTRDAVEAVKKAAARRGCTFQVHPMLCAVYVMTEQ